MRITLTDVNGKVEYFEGIDISLIDSKGILVVSDKDHKVMRTYILSNLISYVTEADPKPDNTLSKPDDALSKPEFWNWFNRIPDHSVPVELVEKYWDVLDNTTAFNPVRASEFMAKMNKYLEAMN